ncbi:hypothetical protein ACFH04_08550 [Streptomyces noboritoensis]|uniref:Lantibiotic n=1 Tax=Streptomyces noboritoensis TaxID=67337 RepID=A0ABV6TD84_9ACTN
MTLELLDRAAVEESFDIEVDFLGLERVEAPELGGSTGIACANTVPCCVSQSPTSCGQTYGRGVSMCPTC